MTIMSHSQSFKIYFNEVDEVEVAKGMVEVVHNGDMITVNAWRRENGGRHEEVHESFNLHDMTSYSIMRTALNNSDIPGQAVYYAVFKLGAPQWVERAVEYSVPVENKL